MSSPRPPRNPNRKPPPYSLEQYAREKKLPAAWLAQEFALRTHREREVAIPYLDAEGNPAFEKYRAGDGRFRAGKGAKLIPYGLDRLDEAGSVLIVEGESDVHTLARHGVAAVGIPGARNWKPEWTKYLDGLDIRVWKEPDDAGADMVRRLAADLPDARVIEAPEDAKDPSDLHLADSDAFLDRLTGLMRDARPITEVVEELPAPKEEEGGRVVVPSPKQPMGVARRLVNDVYTGPEGHALLHDFRGDFYRYDSTCWPEIRESVVRAAAYRYLEDAFYLKATKDGIEFESWNPTRYKITDVLDALRAIVLLEGEEPPAWTSDRQEPPADEMVSMANGLLHLPSRRLYDHTPAYFNYHSLPFAFDPEAPRPRRWLAFLEELWEGDPTAISALQEVFGYILGGDTRQQKIFLLVGPRRAGKGTIGRVLTGLLGAHNVAAPTLASMATNFGLQPLIGKPLGLISDARLSGRSKGSIVVERLLSISGEDSLTIDRKYREPWTGRLPTRLVILTNELPRLSDSSGALASRFILFVLTKSFLGQEDPNLTDKLLAEAPGIFNWALQGLDRLVERGYFKPPDSGREAVQQLEDLSSPISAFVRERCVTGAEESVPVDYLWKSWKRWCEDDNRHPGTKQTFGRNLKAALPTIRRSKPRSEEGDERIPTYVGIGLQVTPPYGEREGAP